MAALDTQLREALRRIERLERIAAENGLEAPYSPGEKRGRGRPSGVPPEQLEVRTESLVFWLEDNWPEISRGLNVAQNEQQVAEVLKSGRQNSHTFYPPFVKAPERFASECWKFIHSKRYHQNPRNLAAAMAGLPEISVRTSFNRCHKYAANCHPVGYRAYREHLRRKFHDRFRKLTAAASTEEVVTILRGSKSKDAVLRHLSENPDKVLRWLECGIPGNTRLYDEPNL